MDFSCNNQDFARLNSLEKILTTLEPPGLRIKRSLDNVQAPIQTFGQSANCWYKDCLWASVPLLRMFCRLAGEGAFFFCPCLPGDTGSDSGPHAQCPRRSWGGYPAGVSRPRALGSVRPAPPSLPSTGAGSQRPESQPLPSSSFPPPRDSQVGPVPPPLISGHNGAAEDASTGEVRPAARCRAAARLSTSRR